MYITTHKALLTTVTVKTDLTPAFYMASYGNQVSVVGGFFVVKFCDLAHHLEVCASSGSAYCSVMGRTKWPTTYTRYFELGMQLPPALQSPFSWGVVMLEKIIIKKF